VVIRALPSSREVPSSRLGEQLRAGLRRIEAAGSKRWGPWQHGCGRLSSRSRAGWFSLSSCTATWCRRCDCRRAGSLPPVVSTRWTPWLNSAWCGAVGWQQYGWRSAVRGIGEDGTRYRSTEQPGSKTGTPQQR